MRGAAILASTAILAKLIGAVFKIPLYNLLGNEGTGYFTITYSIYTLLLTISYSGIPVALSRLISASAEKGETGQVKRYFSVALPAFAVVGAIFSLVMFIFAPQLAEFMENPPVVPGIRLLSPAVFLCCVVSVYEGFSQGHGDMVPTAVKQMLEVTCKLVIGMSLTWILIARGADAPTQAAGAITGVVVGLFIALPVMVIYKRRRAYTEVTETATAPKSRSETLATIFKVSIPITLGASFMTIMTILDSKVVLMRLADGLQIARAEATALYGVYTKMQTLFNLPPSLVVPVTVSIIPAISAALTARRNGEARKIMESSMKLVSLIAMPAGIGMCVLSPAIVTSLYGGDATGAKILSIFGIASFFTCMQLMTTATLQAAGHERVPMLTFPIGGALQLLCDWLLVGNPNIGIVGSPVGTLVCYASITVMNLFVIIRKLPEPPRLMRVFVRPLLISLVMGAAAWAVYGVIARLHPFGDGRLAVTLYLAGTIVVAVIVYAVLVIISGTVTREDLASIPKGDKIARRLHLK
jgi:stage V sporulation protein B